MKLKHYIFVFLFPFLNFAQDGVLDNSFGNNGYVFTDFFGKDDSPKKIGQQSDNKIIVLGFVEIENSVYTSTFTRYNENGDIDLTFGEDGTVFFEYNSVNTLLILDDDKMIVSGTLGDEFFLIRYNPDGTIDNSFGNNGVVSTSINYSWNNVKSVVLTNDNKLIVIGDYDNKIILNKFFLDGELDTSFGDNGIVSYENGEFIISSEGRVQSDGNIVVSAKWTNADYSERTIFFMRFLENGNIDSSFGDNGITTTHISNHSVYGNYFSIDSSNRIVAAYYEYYPATDMFNSNAYRVLPNGEIDSSFGEDGLTNLGNYLPKDIIIQPNSRILIGGGIPFSEGRFFAIKRILANGEFDNSFSQVIEPIFDYSSIKLLNSGKILGIGGTFMFSGDINYVLSQYNNNPLGIEEYQRQFITITPNPTKGIVLINNESTSVIVSINVYDTLGRLALVQSNTTNQIDLSSLANGLFFVQIETDEGVITKKVIKN